MDEFTSSPRERLILPFMAPFYHGFAQPVGWALFRVIIGGLLMVEGWPKIIAPMAQVGFVENVLGWPAGWFFSPLLAVMQFVGGFLIAIGLLTRPVALANAVMLAITLWFHIVNPYGPVFLTEEGNPPSSATAARRESIFCWTAICASPLCRKWALPRWTA